MIQIKEELINGETSLLGVLGSPVNHSLSPIIHNAAFKELNLNWCYLAIPCEADDLELILTALKSINCKGLNITIPHKNNVFKLCDQVTSIAKDIGAVNTLIPNKRKGWNGANTDIEGFLAPISNKYTNIKKALVIGTGGSAKAVVFGLMAMKFAEITIISRTKSSITNFINSININSNQSTKIIGITNNNSLLKDKIREAQIIINATPIGMYSKTNKKYLTDVPLGEEIWKNLNSTSILYDLVYTPRPTKWLQLGKQYGCKAIDGLEMLVQQGAASIRLWSGIKDIPTDIMREAAKTVLK